MSETNEVTMGVFVFPGKTFYVQNIEIDWDHWPVEGFVFQLSETKKDAEYRPMREAELISLVTYDASTPVTGLRDSRGTVVRATGIKFIR